MGELLLPPGAARARREQVAQQRGKGLGKAVHEIDPKEQIFRQVGMTKDGKIPGYRLHGNRVLVGVYERPEKLESGIILSDVTRKEDMHQGKAGLVLMLGHSAFQSDDHFEFGPDHADVGDWISLWVSEGRSIIVNGQLCRILRDQDVNMVIPSPDAVY